MHLGPSEPPYLPPQRPTSASPFCAAAMADVEEGEETCVLSSHSGTAGSKSGGDKMFSLKKWNAVAMWSWDVECDTCAICRVQVMGKQSAAREAGAVTRPAGRASRASTGGGGGRAARAG